MTVVDVRTPGEFLEGNVPNSINIPLIEVPKSVDQFKEMKQPIILCCASGIRSGQAMNFLKSQGIECENAGGWREVHF
ncbi:MAG: phage shock protein E [Lentimonas sp.]|jgi:phage shock protein E